MSSNSLSTAASGLASTAAGVALGGAVPAKAAPQAAKLVKVAQQFEAIFTRQILGAARKANFGDTLFSDSAMDTFGAMEDAKFADISAAHGTLGIAKMLEHVLGQRQAAQDAATAPANKAGG